jgi:hypothetical protein
MESHKTSHFQDSMYWYSEEVGFYQLAINQKVMKRITNI